MMARISMHPDDVKISPEVLNPDEGVHKSCWTVKVDKKHAELSP